MFKRFFFHTEKKRKKKKKVKRSDYPLIYYTFQMTNGRN